MAPKRKRDDANAASASATTRSAARGAARGTQSATRRGDAVLKPALDNPERRKRKKAKTVIIEHCSQNPLFTKKANQVNNGLKKAVAGVNVVVNPEEPRNGCFEIRGGDGEVFVSLVDMVSPFAELAALDVKVVVRNIVQRLN